MRLFNKNPVNPNTVVIYISCLVFLLRLYACRYLYPDFDAMDYYGYAELAKNIFHHLDFTVRWELDQPVQYPPFFSILAHLVTYLTKNFVISIQLISIFSASFLLIPLFSLVRSILNIYSASLAVLFAVYYFGIQPCHLLTMDFFFSFLIIVICWLVWDTLTHHSRQAGRYVLAGFLVSMAYLTKFSSGLVFGYAAIASILYYFARSQRDFGGGVKMSVWLLLGAAPLMMAYHLLLGPAHQKQIPNIAAYAFLDGNYMFEKGWHYREEKISELNPQGTEFSHIERLKSGHEMDLLLSEPLYLFAKYLWGLDKMTQQMTFSVLPGGYIPNTKFINISPNGIKVFDALKDDGWHSILREVSAQEVVVNPDYGLTKETVRLKAGHDSGKVWKILSQYRNSRKVINFLFQGAFLILLVISGFYYRWHYNLMHIVFFTMGLVLIPLYSISERYLMPYSLPYFVLWLFILNAGYGVIAGEIKDKNFLRNIVLIVFASLFLIYFVDSCKQYHQRFRYFKLAGERNAGWLQVASWIKKDARHLPRRAKIMACSDNYVSYLTDSDYIRLPYVISDWNKIVNFAALKNVDYIVVDLYNLDSFLSFSEDDFKKPLTPEGLLKAIKAGSVRAAGSVNWIMEKAGVPPGTAPVETLNKLLGFRELYQVMPLWPAGSTPFIEQLEAGKGYSFFELKETNRLLMEINYAKEAPRKLLLNRGSGPVKMAHKINSDNDTFWIFKL
jgi:hypothetical protein